MKAKDLEVTDGVTTFKDLVKQGLHVWEPVQWRNRDDEVDPELKVIKCGNIRMYTPREGRIPIVSDKTAFQAYLVGMKDYLVYRSEAQGVDLYLKSSDSLTANLDSLF